MRFSLEERSIAVVVHGLEGSSKDSLFRFSRQFPYCAAGIYRAKDHFSGWRQSAFLGIFDGLKLERLADAELDSMQQDCLWWILKHNVASN